MCSSFSSLIHVTRNSVTIIHHIDIVKILFQPHLACGVAHDIFHTLYYLHHQHNNTQSIMFLPLFVKPTKRYAHIPYTPLAAEQQRLNSRQRFFFAKHVYKILAVVLLLVTAVITTVCLLRDPHLERLRQPSAPVPVIPQHFRVVGLVFYGRRSRVEVLDCYLKVRDTNSSLFSRARSRLG